MGKCFLHGNGGYTALTYKIVGGTSAPANPKANTIWVNTSNEIKSHVFSATEPRGSSGMLWIKVGSGSPVSLSVTKKNPITVYPISAKMYVNSSWVSVTAKSYVNGGWKDWMVYIFKSGEGNSSDFESAVYGDTYGTVEITNSYIYTSQGYGECLLGFQTRQRVDLSDVDTIYFEVECSANMHDFSLGVSSSSLLEYLAMGAEFAASTMPSDSGKQTLSVNVSGLSGAYYIGGRTNPDTGAVGSTDVRVTNIWYV